MDKDLNNDEINEENNMSDISYNSLEENKNGGDAIDEEINEFADDFENNFTYDDVIDELDNSEQSSIKK